MDAASIANAQTLPELALLLRQLRRREARRREGAELTYRQLAAKAGWSHAVIADYLTGKTLPPIDRFDVLIQLLGAAPAEQGALATARDRVAERRLGAGPTRPGARPPVPRQLPADVPEFIGRAAELADLDRLLAAARRRSAVAVAVITGPAGVGKSALAVHWAQRVKHRFPHGQLYADLSGHGSHRPTPPALALDRYLAGLGVRPEATPRDPDAKAALYRSLLDRRRLLVVLDDAATADQVRPLLPGGSGCLVLVTSRHRLTGLVARDRAHRITLDVLPPQDAVALLAGLLGPTRVAAEATAAGQLARLCDYRPAALCAAASRTHATLAGLVAEVATGDQAGLLTADDE